LPNALQTDEPQANFYQAGNVHLFPDPDRIPVPDPFDLIINDATIGTEVLRCLATAVNVTHRLPEALRGQTFDPLPQRYAARLREIFEDLGGPVAQTSITISVLP
jgi:hypothetical protein